jgi:hypothetical protein
MRLYTLARIAVILSEIGRVAASFDAHFHYGCLKNAATIIIQPVGIIIERPILVSTYIEANTDFSCHGNVIQITDAPLNLSTVITETTTEYASLTKYACLTVLFLGHAITRDMLVSSMNISKDRIPPSFKAITGRQRKSNLAPLFRVLLGRSQFLHQTLKRQVFTSHSRAAIPEQ